MILFEKVKVLEKAIEDTIFKVTQLIFKQY